MLVLCLDQALLSTAEPHPTAHILRFECHWCEIPSLAIMKEKQKQNQAKAKNYFLLKNAA